MRFTKLLALLAALGFVVAACGGESDVITEATPAPTTAAPDETAAPAADPGTSSTTGVPPTTAPAPAGQVAGDGGELLLLQWQAPSIANPYLSTGTKDVMTSSLVLEALAEYSPNGALIPALAAEIPSVSNGGISEDLTQITWTLKEGIVFSDGSPLTSADVVFSYDYCIDELTGCASAAFTEVVSVVADDDMTVTITFDAPTPFPFAPFVGFTSPILQQAQFADCVGEAAQGCSEQNLGPIGTGPFMITELRPEDTAQFVFNPLYRLVPEGKPFFGSVQIKGGGDAEASARSVLEIGEADYAWNLQVAPELLGPMEAAGNGEVVVAFASSVEHILLNQTDPTGPNASDYVDGANPNPFFFENPELQRALSIAINRDELVVVGYGANGSPTCNMWNVPGQVSTNNDWCLTQDIDGANAILDGLGYMDTDDDGVRELPDGTPLEWDYFTSTNAVRQSNQDLIKSYWADIGVNVNMQNESASIFFDGSQASPNNIWAFPWDIEMFTTGPDSPDPQTFLNNWQTEQIPESSNNFAGGNIVRLASDEYDAIFQELTQTALDDPARNDLVIQLNDIASTTVIPLILRGSVSAFANDIEGQGDLNAWDSEYYNIEEWTRAG